MELEIVWTQFAENKLLEIYHYYKIKEGTKTAKKIVTEIVDKTINLENHPKIGAIEELLSERIQEYRYLISTNYKIIYYINFNSKRIVISNVFDTRQNPEKLLKTKS